MRLADGCYYVTNPGGDSAAFDGRGPALSLFLLAGGAQ